MQKNRHKTTKIRISAHDLEIETGRYNRPIKTPRNERICKWCNLSTGTSQIENENHMLFTCDLYAPIRSKLVNTLRCTVNKAISNSTNNSNQELETIRTAFENISIPSLYKDFPKLQSASKETTLTFNDFFINITSPSQHVALHDPLQYHFTQKSRQNSTFLEYIRSYIQNALASFTRRCFEKRDAFIKELTKK